MANSGKMDHFTSQETCILSAVKRRCKVEALLLQGGGEKMAYHRHRNGTTESSADKIPYISWGFYFITLFLTILIQYSRYWKTHSLVKEMCSADERCTS
jgi:hypothetical protein